MITIRDKNEEEITSFYCKMEIGFVVDSEKPYGDSTGTEMRKERWCHHRTRRSTFRKVGEVVVRRY